MHQSTCFISLGLFLHPLYPICQLNCWFSTFSILQSPLLQITTHPSPLLGTTQVTPQGRTWQEQGGHDVCLPSPPPLAPAQRKRQPDLGSGRGRVPASPLPATPRASSSLPPWKGTTDTVLVRLTRTLLKLRICSEVKGPFTKVLRYFPSPDLPFPSALHCPFLSPQP